MNLERIISTFFKEDPHLKVLKQVNLITNSLLISFLPASMKIYEESIDKEQEQMMIKNVLKLLEEKGQVFRKMKIMSLWIEMFKITKYDLSEIIMNKKLKVFTRTATFKEVPTALKENNLEDYLLVNVLVPQYNYFMKLSVNQELFKLCVIGKIPEDDIFRRGTKIKFIWIFKLYNLIHPLIPIVQSCATVLTKFPQFDALREIANQCYRDILVMNDFVIEAIEEGAEDNFLLMPYFQMLQFYETVSEQKKIYAKIQKLYTELNKNDKRQSMQLPTPRQMRIDEQLMDDIQTQTMRVKLISISVKNPKKDYSRLETEYHDRLEQRQQRILKTSANGGQGRETTSFTEKYRYLD